MTTNLDPARFLEILREEFDKLISVKTGWGKNEILINFDKASIKALIRYGREKDIPLD